MHPQARLTAPCVPVACVLAPNFDLFRRPTLTPAESKIREEPEQVSSADVGSIFDAEWGSNATPVHTRAAVPARKSEPSVN